MKPIPRHHWHDLASLAVTLCMLALGLAMMAVGWRKAHAASPQHVFAPHPAHHNPPAIASTSKP